MKKKIFKIISIPLLFIILVLILNKNYSAAVYNIGDTNMEKINNSPQYSNGKFHNFVEWQEPSFFEYIGTFWDFLTTGNDRTPSDSIPGKTADLSYINRTGNNKLNVTWLGHSSLMINIDGYKILTDPVFEKRVSIFGPTRFNGDVPVEISELPFFDVILISHNHYDHLNKFSILNLDEKTSKFVVPLGVGAELEKWGVHRSKIVETDWWDEIKIDDNFSIVSTPSQHFSGRGLSDRNSTLWCSFVIQTQNHKIYFSGDSGYFDGFKTIGEKYGPFDMTFIECGAYNEKWHHIHMYPEETVQAHIDLKGKVLHPIHWGTFNLSLHSWYEPMQRLTEAANSANIKTATPVVGGTTEFGKFIPSEEWWNEIIPGKTKLAEEL